MDVFESLFDFVRGICLLLLGVQMTLSHYRQIFHHKAVWIPVVASPLFFNRYRFSVAHLNWLYRSFVASMWVGVMWLKLHELLTISNSRPRSVN